MSTNTNFEREVKLVRKAESIGRLLGTISREGYSKEEIGHMIQRVRKVARGGRLPIRNPLAARALYLGWEATVEKLDPEAIQEVRQPTKKESQRTLVDVRRDRGNFQSRLPGF